MTIRTDRSTKKKKSTENRQIERGMRELQNVKGEETRDIVNS